MEEESEEEMDVEDNVTLVSGDGAGRGYWGDIVTGSATARLSGKYYFSD